MNPKKMNPLKKNKYLICKNINRDVQRFARSLYAFDS